jgi:hypothetical protein
MRFCRYRIREYKEAAVMEDTETLREELGRTRQVLEELLGKPSRWSGVLELTSDPSVNGAKPFRCDIVLNTILLGQDVRWRTLIHEMLHTFSAGYNRRDFDSFPGWEEGVVEQLQRLLRPTILARLGVTVAEAIFDSVEAGHKYNGYIRALNAIRQHLNIPAQQFHFDLLSEPIRDRGNSILRTGMLMPPVQRAALISIYSVSNAVLRVKI